VLFIWNWNTFQSHNLPPETFTNSKTVAITETEDKITFKASDTDSKLEVIFFQGGLTNPKAYAPLCRKLAEYGFTSHLMKMDWRLPQYNYQKTADIFNLKHGNFVIGGHSQGAKIAAQFGLRKTKSI
jgi:predicted esterase